MRPVSTTKRGKTLAARSRNGRRSDHLRNLPVENKGDLPVIPVDARAAEVRAIKMGCLDLGGSEVHVNSVRLFDRRLV
jgi:hypothetical protein